MLSDPSQARVVDGFLRSEGSGRDGVESSQLPAEANMACIYDMTSPGYIGGLTTGPQHTREDEVKLRVWLKKSLAEADLRPLNGGLAWKMRCVEFVHTA